jgi:eukaryotic-like serine/threonine-protein kinase
MREPVPEPWSPPTHFDGFELRGLLGQGGMGRVYLAYEATLDRLVAVKFILGRGQSQSARERFLFEARAVARLVHANVVAVHRIGEVAGEPYIAYEHVAGRNLTEFARPAAWPEVLRVGLGVARALAAVHSKGVLHRDVKPANILESESGELKLVDFGLAKLHATESAAATSSRRRIYEEQGALEDSATAATLPHPASSDVTLPLGSRLSVSVQQCPTATGVLVGTPLYVAPEVWLGGAATPASDVFALGLVLYELATGNLPHAELPPRQIASHVIENDLPSVRVCRADFPQAIAKVIGCALARNPEERFPSGVELCEALESLHSVLRGFHVLAPPPKVDAPSVDAASLVSASLARLSARSEALYTDVYASLFTLHPELRSLFPLDLSGQRAKLASALQLVVENLRNPVYVVTLLEELGERHLAYGAVPQHLDILGDVLLTSLERYDPTPWDPTLREAWRAAYAAIAQGMRRGFRSAILSRHGREAG